MGHRTTHQDWVSADIQQVLVATHGAPFVPGLIEANRLQFLASNFFHSFTANHYAMFHKEAGLDGFDFSYVKLHPDFWKSDKDGKDCTQMRQVFLPSGITIREPTSLTASRIPRRFVYVYEENLLDVEDPVEQFFNVWDTIEMYRKAWNMTKADLWFVDDFVCLGALYSEKPELLQYYGSEKNEQRKQDICRTVAMKLSGGYYFDVNLEVGTPFTPADDATLVVAKDETGRISRDFMAVESQSNVMALALENILNAYKQNKTSRSDFELGSETLAESISALAADSSMRTDYIPLSQVGGEFSRPWIAPIPPADSFVKDVPANMLGPLSSDAKIPHRLIFTFKYNILEKKEPPILYKNVLNTIATYRKAWGEPDAPVWFMDDDDCRSAIYMAKPNLVNYFDREPHGSWKADICRVAALYLTGGYYFDVDMEAVNAWMPDSNVTFATAIDPPKVRYFQSFLASEQKGRILEEGLDEMLLFYENRKTRTKSFIGPDTLKWATDAVAPSEQGEIVILEEVTFLLANAETQERRDSVGCCCHFKVQAPDTKENIFYSRAVGAGGSCFLRNSTKGREYIQSLDVRKDKGRSSIE